MKKFIEITIEQDGKNSLNLVVSSKYSVKKSSKYNTRLLSSALPLVISSKYRVKKSSKKNTAIEEDKKTIQSSMLSSKTRNKI